MPRSHLLLLALLAACSTEPDGPSGDDDGLSATEVARIHDAVADHLGHGLATGYSVAIWRDGEVIFAEGFGAKDEAGAAVTPDTLFQIGSDTKKLTAIGLLQQVEAGAVGLDTTLAEAVPGLDFAQAPGATGAITMHDLLSQQTGLFEYT